MSDMTDPFLYEIGREEEERFDHGRRNPMRFQPLCDEEAEEAAERAYDAYLDRIGGSR